MLSYVRTFLNRSLRRSRWEQDLAEELAFHVEARTEDLIRFGLGREEAVRQARLEFGAIEARKEECRDTSRFAAALEELRRNVRYSLRSLRKNPVYAVVGVLSLALGIGANIATFNLVERLMLHSLPVQDPNGLYQVGSVGPQGFRSSQSYVHFNEIRSNKDLFSDALAWSSPWEMQVKVGEQVEQARLSAVSGSYFPMLGTGAVVGRTLTEQDDRPRSENVVMLSYLAWQRLFKGDASAIERTMHISGIPFRVVGIAPPTFFGLEPGAVTELFVPLHNYVAFNKNAVTAEGMMWLHTMVRLQPNVPLEAARKAFAERALEKGKVRWKQFGRLDTQKPPVLQPAGRGYSEVRNEYSTALVVLLVLVGMVLLIACANLSTLLFVRGALRAGEMSLRLALGASPAQLVRQWLTECMIIALAGGLAGLVLAKWMVDVLLLFVGENAQDTLRFQANWLVMSFALLVTVAAGLLFGLAPSMRASRVDPGPALKEAASSVAGRRGKAWRWVLAGQIAASLVLVTGAVLFARTLWNLNTASVGFARSEVVWAQMKFNRTNPPKREQYEEAVERLRQSPLFAGVSMGRLPVSGNGGWNWAIVPGYQPAPNEDNIVYLANVLPGYFQVMKIDLLRGRDFEQRDRVWPPPTVIVSESFARHYFGDRDPVGMKVGIYRFQPPSQIIGVVRDTRYSSVREAKRDVAYSAIAAGSFGPIVARVRKSQDQAAALNDLRGALAAAAPKAEILSGTMDELIEKSIRRDILIGRLSALFGVLGIVIGAIGLYGTLAHEVASHTREVGIRMALGASLWSIVKATGASVGSIVGWGFIVGVPLSLVSARLIESLLYNVSPADPMAIATSILVLSATALGAAFVPLRRATQIDPLHSLRHE